MRGWLWLVSGLLVAACNAAPMAEGYLAPVDAGTTADGATSTEAGAAEPTDDDAGAFSPYLRGALAVQSRGCPRCHQSDNPDDGVLSGQSTPVPGTRIYGKNLTPDPETGIGGFTDTQVVRMMRQGKDEEGQSLCDVMPRYMDMDADEQLAILAYLRAQKPVHREVPDGVCVLLDADGGTGSAADGGDAGACRGLIGPGAAAPCHACLGRPCQANGCFNGYVCALASATCVPPVPGCG